MVGLHTRVVLLTLWVNGQSCTIQYDVEWSFSDVIFQVVGSFPVRNFL